MSGVTRLTMRPPARPMKRHVLRDLPSQEHHISVRMMDSLGRFRHGVDDGIMLDILSSRDGRDEQENMSVDEVHLWKLFLKHLIDYIKSSKDFWNGVWDNVMNVINNTCSRGATIYEARILVGRSVHDVLTNVCFKSGMRHAYVARMVHALTAYIVDDIFRSQIIMDALKDCEKDPTNIIM